MISLEAFFTTNRAPNNEELEALKNVVSRHHVKWATNASKISDLQAQLQILNNEKEAIMGAVAPFRRALLPFRQLPEDVIREIFVACLPTERNPTMANTEAPVLLTQISSATRRIALTTPALWTAIHISMSVLPWNRQCATSILAARAKGVEDWLLRRSGCLPLYISVHHCPRTRYEDQRVGQEIIDVLMSCCSRWRHLFFERLPKYFLRISTLTGIDVPILSSLSILPYSSDQYDDLWESSSIWAAPMLQRLSVSGMPMDSGYPVNWSNLTHIGFPLEVYHCTEQEFVDNIASILRQTTRLSSCRLFIPGVIKLSNSAKIHLPFLKHLIVSRSTDYDWQLHGIIAMIHAPALEAIQYNTNDEIIGRPGELICLLSQAPNLQELYTGIFDKARNLEECLEYCPSITSLRIHGVYGEDKKHFVKHGGFIESFILDDVTECLCPKLKYFHCERHLNLPIHILYQFITRKNRPNQSLSRWSTLVLKVNYLPEDEHLLPYIRQITAKKIIGDMKISLEFKRWTKPYRSLDKGLDDPKTQEDAWWQSQSMFPISNI